MTERNAEADPKRWAEESEASDDARLSVLFRAVGEPQPLSQGALARVHDRLQSKRRTRLLSRRMRELVLAVSMLLLGSSLALAGWGASEWLSGRSQRAQPPAPENAAQKAPRTQSDRRRPKLKEPAPAPLLQEQSAPLASSENDAELNPTNPRTTTSVERRGGHVVPADSSKLAAEAQALEHTLVKLRREHDALGALSVLDESRELFAQGTLALEAQIARLDALLALGRRGDALSLLEQLPLAQIGRRDELQLLRAELRAADDCGRALADFDALVARALPAALFERALYGRAACELQVADRTHAEQDLKRYLARFPQGRFADRVRGELSKLRTKAQ